MTEKTKFLMLSSAGDGVAIAYRLGQEGHDVAVDIRDDRQIHCGDGLINKIHDWNFEVTSNCVVIADCSGFGPLLDLYRHNGVRVNGGSTLADRLEMDRRFANSGATAAGLSVPNSRWFEDWDEGLSFAGENPEPLVFKPGLEMSGVIPSFVARDQRELVKMINHYQHLIHGHAGFMLQEVKDGTDISTAGWFNGYSFLHPFTHTLEQKHLMNGNLGPSGGCVGNVVWACSGCPICEELTKTESYLRENDYGPGQIDINCIVGDDGITFIEFTPRFGYDATPTEFYALFDEPIGEFFVRLSAGSTHDIAYRGGFAAGVRLTRSPWPLKDGESCDGVPVKISQSMLNNFAFNELAIDDEGDFVTSGGEGLIGVVMGYGNTLMDSFDDAYSGVKKIKIPDVQYRTDLAEEFSRSLRKVHRVLEGVGATT
jgi:phosphoribosylamine-glycine ligase